MKIRSILLMIAVLISCEVPSETVVDENIITVSAYISFDENIEGISFDNLNRADETIFFYDNIQLADGSTSQDLLVKINEIDQYMYFNFSGYSTYGLALYGMCYDSDQDLDFPIWGTDADNPTYIDSDDLARYGWLNGYWSFYISDTDLELSYSQVGISSRVLKEGSCDVFAFQKF